MYTRAVYETVYILFSWRIFFFFFFDVCFLLSFNCKQWVHIMDTHIFVMHDRTLLIRTAVYLRIYNRNRVECQIMQTWNI